MTYNPFSGRVSMKESGYGMFYSAANEVPIYITTNYASYTAANAILKFTPKITSNILHSDILNFSNITVPPGVFLISFTANLVSTSSGSKNIWIAINQKNTDIPLTDSVQFYNIFTSLSSDVNSITYNYILSTPTEAYTIKLYCGMVDNDGAKFTNCIVNNTKNIGTSASAFNVSNTPCYTLTITPLF